MRKNVCDKPLHLKKFSHDGFHQDDAESMHLLFKGLSEIECRLFKLDAHCREDNDCAKVIPKIKIKICLFTLLCASLSIP